MHLYEKNQMLKYTFYEHVANIYLENMSSLSCRGRTVVCIKWFNQTGKKPSSLFKKYSN